MIPSRILVVAENASTRLGGEAILPHHYFRLLRRRGLDAHLIVHARMRAELEATFADDLERLHFVPDQLLQKLFFKLGRLLPRRIDEATLGLANQLLTQRAQRRVIRRLLLSGTVIHQPIPVAPRFPSALSNLGAPLVVGPLNGGMEFPQPFRASESSLTRFLVTFARSLTDTAGRIFTGKRDAAIVLVANARTRTVLPGGLRGRVVELVENGVDTAQWSQSIPSPLSPGSEQPQPPRFIFIGRLVDWKALDLALEALVRVPGATLDVIGDGPMLQPWRECALALGLTARFHGWRSQAECANLVTGATALLLPSVYECGGAVVLEAMAAGLPVIATAWGGPLDYLDQASGFLIPPTSRDSLITGFAKAMLALANAPELRHRMGIAGQDRARRHFDWEQKIDVILSLYEEALQ